MTGHIYMMCWKHQAEAWILRVDEDSGVFELLIRSELPPNHSDISVFFQAFRDSFPSRNECPAVATATWPIPVLAPIYDNRQTRSDRRHDAPSLPLAGQRPAR